MSDAGVLRTRLLAPRPPPGCVSRDALVATLRRGLQGPLVAIVAGAGYGKTTLLAQALESLGRPFVWCSCDARMAGSRSLVAHLAAGLRQRFPGFGVRLDLAGTPAEQVAGLCNEMLDMVAEDLVLVMDDVHLLPERTPAVLGLLVEGAGPGVHLAMAGRAPLPFPLARLRLGRVVELDEATLAFDEAEAGELVRSLGLGLDADEVASLHRRTEGWAAGLILAAQAAATAGAAPAGRLDYLAEEVLGRQPAATRRFLLDTAVLGRFSPELAERVSGRRDARALLDDLVARHLFTVRLDAEGRWYRYHHLLREFLRQRLAEHGPARLAELHRSAAAWWSERDEPAEAVPHLLAAGEVAAAVAALEPVAEGMALGPQAESLGAWLEEMPRERWAARPGLMLANATLLLVKAQHEASFEEFERAIGELVAAGEHGRAAAALVRLQQAMLGAGTRPGRRAEAGERWRRRIAPGAPLLPAARILLASAYGYGCRFAEARAELAAALALPAARGSRVLPLYADVVRAFYLDHWQGRPQDALAALEGAIAALERHRAEDVLSFGLFAGMLRCYVLNELGRWAEAMEVTERFMEVARRRGIDRLFARSFRWVRATWLMGLGRWEEVADEITMPPRAPDPAQATSYSHRYRAVAARVAGRRGDQDQVRAQTLAAREEMRTFGRAFDDATFLSDFALAAADAGLADLAEECSRDALDAAEDVASPWLLARAGLVAAHCRPGAAGDAPLARCLEVTERHDLADVWTRRERPRAPALLARAIVRGLGPPGAAERLLAACGAEAFAVALDAMQEAEPDRRAVLAELSGTVADVDIALVDRLLRDRDATVREAARRSWRRLKARPRAGLRILSLGDLRVLRDGVPVPSRAFVRQKARALLGALLAADGPIHRETLGGWLWPDLPAERGAGALRTTLHDLRRALEPELDAGSPDSLLSAAGESVRLELTDRDSWDVVEWRRLTRVHDESEPPVERVARLRAAEVLRAGPFLAEWPYEDWAMPLRRDLDEELLRVLERLARALLAAGEPAEAIPRWRRLVAIEPQREGWHRELMTAYAAAGERALALRQYHACRAVLRREQGIEPSPETRARYLALLRQEPQEGAPPTT